MQNAMHQMWIGTANKITNKKPYVPTHAFAHRHTRKLLPDRKKLNAAARFMYEITCHLSFELIPR